MTFLNDLWNYLVTKFQNQIHKFAQAYLSEIFILDATETVYIGELRIGSNDLPTTEKLGGGVRFAVAGHSLEVAKIKTDSTGAPLLTGADWKDYVDDSIWGNTPGTGGLTQAEQVRQIYNAKIQLYRGNKLIRFPEATSRYKNDGPLSGAAVGNYSQFVPIEGRFIRNGDAPTESTYQVKLTLPDGSQTDLLEGVAVRFREIGFEAKALCGDISGLNEIPSDCNSTMVEDDCNCNGTTTTAQASSVPTMIQNQDNDLGYIN